MTFKAKIRDLCQKKGLTVYKIEKDLGLGNGTISHWDKSDPKVQTLQKVCDYLNVTMDEVLKDVYTT